MKGLIYVLYNASMPDLVKIGKTTRTAEERAQELSSTTGIPTPFVVVYEALVDNIDIAEQMAHQHMEELGYRRNKEFFTSPIKHAVFVVEHLKNHALPAGSLPAKTQQPPNMQQVLEEARRYHHGDSTTLPDLKKAEKLYKQASTWSGFAARELGDMYWSRGGKPNTRKAIDFTLQAVNLGEKGLLLPLVCMHRAVDEDPTSLRFLEAYVKSSEYSEEELTQFLFDLAQFTNYTLHGFKPYFEKCQKPYIDLVRKHISQYDPHHLRAEDIRKLFRPGWGIWDYPTGPVPVAEALVQEFREIVKASKEEWDPFTWKFDASTDDLW